MTDRAQLRFSRLHVENWRNFARIEVDLQQRVFLVGPNASGKSNLLDVFRFLRDLGAVGGSSQEAVESRGGLPRLRCLAARNPSDVVVGVDLGDTDSAVSWSYQLSFGQDSRKHPIVKKEIIRKNGSEILSRPDDDDRRDPVRLTQTHLEQVNVNQAFRDVATFFASVRYLHIVPQLIRDPERSAGRKNDPYGGDFLEQIARTPEKTRKGRLTRIRRALRVAVPQLKQLELARDRVGTPHLRGKYEHWRPQGAWQTEGQFSDGTLRLLGLLWAALDGSGPLLLEEPELSIHSEVVRFIPQMFARIQSDSGRQILTSTHSPELLSDESIGLDEVLLLQPGTEGTTVRLAKDFLEVRELLGGGANLAEAVIPRTRPAEAHQLTLFSR